MPPSNRLPWRRLRVALVLLLALPLMAADECGDSARLAEGHRDVRSGGAADVRSGSASGALVEAASGSASGALVEAAGEAGSSFVSTSAELYSAQLPGPSRPGPSIPEPSGLLLFGVGAALGGAYLRPRRSKPKR